MSSIEISSADRSALAAMFDREWYRKEYPDVAALGMDPLDHFLWIGWRACRDPNPAFSTQAYLLANPDVAAAGENPALHYVRCGRAERRAVPEAPDPHAAASVRGARPRLPTPSIEVSSADRSALATIFDRDWYRNEYPDVEALGIDPLDHFLWLGWRVCRNPSPSFNTRAYLLANPDVAAAGENPALHYLRCGRAEGRPAPEVPRLWRDSPSKRLVSDGLRRIEGNTSHRAGHPTVLLCAHVVGEQLFGGERSFLDMLDGVAGLGCNVVVSIPQERNSAYLEAVKARASRVLVFPYRWWRTDPPDERAIANFCRVIAEEKIDIVHANTIMLREPTIAARRMGIPAIVHARELIRHDEALINMIGVSVNTIIETVWENCDALIVNSKATAACFDTELNKSSVVYNTANMEQLGQVPRPRIDGSLRVGLISNNAPKKGVFTFAEIARIVCAKCSNVDFVAIGPKSEHTAKIEAGIEAGLFPRNLRFIGYRATPEEALAETDVVLSLSRFMESFGRTVLEAMASRRPTIVFDHGALPELTLDGETGFVVPFGDTGAVAERICALAGDRGRIQEMGTKARARAETYFSAEAHLVAMNAAYSPFLRKDAAYAPVATTLPARALGEKLDRKHLKIAYFAWHFPVPSETFVLNELRILKTLGMDVIVFCRHSPHEFRPDFDIAWEHVSSHGDLARRLVETQRQIIHAHFVYPTVTDMVWPAAEEANIPFTCIAHAQDIFRYSNAAANRIGEFSRSPRCRQIFTLSNYHRDYLIKEGVPADKITINSNCIDPELFVSGKIADRAQRCARKICAVARFDEKKGLIHLIRAGRLLQDMDIGINIFGYGPLESALRTALADEGLSNVSIHEAIEGRESLLRVFREHDLFVCPSVRAADGDMDGIPTTLMESLAAGLPVLTTGVAGIPDLVQDGITGLICDATPEGIAAKVREYYALPDAAIRALIENGGARVLRNHHGRDLVDTLLRFWANETFDIAVVTQNNLPQTSEVIRRLYQNTALPFHLVVCDNGSGKDLLAHLLSLYAEKDNFTLVLNRSNAYVGPGTNICIEQGKSDFVVYVCGKEGMTTSHGWDKPIVRYMNKNSRVGLAGTLGYSPSYLSGRDYPHGIPSYEKFRNRSFADCHPDRIFRHVQGGFFAIRRKMYAEIGGFSNEVPHSYTDVEYSYYVESCGWELGEIPTVMSLFNKTAPRLINRVDDGHSALHPPSLEDLPTLDRIARGQVRHCNVCGHVAELFEGGDRAAICGACASSPRARSLFRVLAETPLLYRRLPAIGIEIPYALRPFWRQQFQGPMLRQDELASALLAGKSLPNTSGSLQVACLNDVLDDALVREPVIAEIGRLLASGSSLFIAGATPTEELDDLLRGGGFRVELKARYASATVRYDWTEIGVYSRCVDIAAASGSANVAANKKQSDRHSEHQANKVVLS